MTTMTDTLLRTITTVALSVTAATAFSHSAGTAAAKSPPSAGDPYACSVFTLKTVQQDAGTSVLWMLDTNCHFAEEAELTVTTTENGVERDTFRTRGRHFEGKQQRKVSLADKPLCASSTVRVVASYKLLSLGDRQSSERVIAYDPNDNCGA